MEKSCGVLAYRWKNGVLQVLLGKNGGPFRGEFSWNIPKGHVEKGESEFQCAVREFKEETGLEVPDTNHCIELGHAKTTSGKKTVVIFAVEHDYNPDGDEVPITSMTFTKEYPKNSGHFITAPELERAKYMNATDATGVMFKYQRVFVERLVGIMSKEKRQ